MGITTAFSVNTNTTDAVKEISAQLASQKPRTVLFFASTVHDPDLLAEKMQEAFGKAMTFGCTTAGEIVTGKMLKKSLVAMALGDDIIADEKIAVMKGVRGKAMVREAFQVFEDHFKVSMKDMDPGKYFGIVLVDGMSGAEEAVIDTAGNLTNVTFIGGSAGDDLQFKKTWVFAQGKAFPDAAILAVLKPKIPFGFLKTQSFDECAIRLVPTRVNEQAREVLEFNNRPAAAVYAEAVKSTVDKASEHFMHNPVGLMIDGEPYVRSPQQIKGDSVLFYCNVKEGMELSLLESRDIVQDTRKAIEKEKGQPGGLAGIINFHCILRTLELDSKGQSGDYGALFSDVPTVGFSTYGEQFIGHINQTSTMLLFRKPS